MDLQTFLATIKRFSTYPLMRLIILPIVYLLFGIVYSARIGKVNVLGSIVLIIFVLLTQLLEQYFYTRQTKKGYIEWGTVYPIIGVNAIIILLFLPLTNVVFTILGLTYFVSILLIYGFFKLRGSLYFIIIQVFLKGLVLNVLSVFMQINFISHELLLAVIPVISALLFYYVEVEKLEIKKFHTFTGNKAMLNMMSVLALLVTIVSPFFIGKLALNQIFKLIMWGLVGAFMAKVIVDNRKVQSIVKAKNFMATVYIIVSVLYCFM